MPRRGKQVVDDEELDRQSFPPPSYESVYPEGPPKKFNSLTSINSRIGESPPNNQLDGKIGDSEEEDSGNDAIRVRSPTTTVTTRVSNNRTSVIISKQPRRNANPDLPSSSTVAGYGASASTNANRASNGSNSSHHPPNRPTRGSRYRREISAREEDQFCCCFACCALCCGQCMSILNGF